MESFITEIKRLREEKGITLEDISKKTRISINYLERIEKGDLEFLPYQYVKGFFKAYAKCIGISVQEVEEKVEELGKAKKKAEEEEKEQKEEEIKLYSEKSAKLKEVKKKIYISAVLVILIGIIIYVGSAVKPDKREIRALDEETFKSIKIAEDKSISEKIPKALEQRKPFQLEVLANEETWVRFIIDKNETKEYILTTGNRLKFEAYDMIEMRIGKTRGLSLFLNGKDLGILGPANTLVWELIHTSEGIKSKELRR